MWAVGRKEGLHAGSGVQMSFMDWSLGFTRPEAVLGMGALQAGLEQRRSGEVLGAVLSSGLRGAFSLFTSDLPSPSGHQASLGASPLGTEFPLTPVGALRA